MPGLLVSVRDAAEAAIALAAGAAIIDVKDPERGSLGAATAATVADVLDTVAGRRPVSAALGELIDWPDGAAGCPAHADRLTFIKWGLAGCRSEDWSARLLGLRAQVEPASPCRVVLATYADWRRAQAPVPADVVHLAIQHRFAAVLLDTWGKDGSSLLDWLSPTQVVELCQPCRAAGVRIALAGSLGTGAIRTLWSHIAPDWFAVRGSVCAGKVRTAGLDPDKLRRYVELVSPPAPPAG